MSRRWCACCSRPGAGPARRWAAPAAPASAGCRWMQAGLAQSYGRRADISSNERLGGICPHPCRHDPACCACRCACRWPCRLALYSARSNTWNSAVFTISAGLITPKWICLLGAGWERHGRAGLRDKTWGGGRGATAHVSTAAPTRGSLTFCAAHPAPCTHPCC